MIINPIEEINKAIPELSTIPDYDNCKIISYVGWDNRMKTIETKNLKKYHKTSTWISMLSYFNPCIVCVYEDLKTIEINVAKYKLIRKYMMSEEFNNKIA